MKKRIAIIGIYHESNTFSSVVTSWENFACGHIFKGAEIIRRYENSHHEIAGFLDEIRSEQVEVVPLFFADAVPSGTIQHQAIQRLMEEIRNSLQLSIPLDGVYCVAHGAAVSQEIRDVDGHWISHVREVIGKDVPIVCTLDPHANVSELMVKASDAMVAYSTNPHLDQKDTGRKAALLLKKLIYGELEMKQELIQLPASLSIEQQETQREPCLSLYQKITHLLGNQQVISHSIILGFPYADVEEMGSSLILITERDYNTNLLKDQVLKIFQTYYPQFTGQRLYIEDVFENKNDLQKPVLLLDMGDNVGAGALGNSPFLFHKLEKHKQNKGIIVLYNPALVDQLKTVEVGQQTSVFIDDDTHPESPAKYRVELLERNNGYFTEDTPRHGGQTSYDMGDSILLKSALGNYIVLCSQRVPPFSSQQLRMFDIDLHDLNWIIAKGVNAPIAAYREYCPTYLKIQTPGESNADATQFQYHYRRKPMIPFENIDK